ncbi:alpha/beta hydrolase [Mucilaginibacter daejeonensis]|uniref:serine aminopeptidase domain-containing protein n=1 Tax=Mucilaginibacter daejeonensis TaxID=398049 RepID=UPI001D177CDC|nr:alpha/beta hydrolase [Mucilaginibacter daejeonensis]UEG52688.1 alpha/beta hydrolase [Mucilaginibacter daejeonensis]
MRRPLLLFTLLFSLCSVWAQSEPVGYRVALGKFMHYYNRNQPDSLFNMFAAEVRSEMPQETNRQMFAELQSRSGALQRTVFAGFENGVATYRADFQKGSLAMKISINSYGKLSGLFFDNIKDPNAKTGARVADPDMDESPLEIKTLSGVVRGTLGLPKQVSGKVPVVIIIPSSGPTDRDGNKPRLNQRTDSYKLLAGALAKNGIATVRYDKRRLDVTSASPAAEKEWRFDDYVDDVVTITNQLKEDQRFSKVILFGHGEGSLVGILASAGQPVSGLISAEGESLSGDKVMTEQLKSQPENITQNFKAILDSLRKGKTRDQVDFGLYSIARPSVQYYLASWMRYDPVKELKKVKIPVLIVQGTTDLQVSMADAERLKKAKSDAKLVPIAGMNYVLKEAPATQAANLATYNQPALPIKPELVTAVTDFVKAVK